MNAQKLVGMTMGARKRRARAEAGAAITDARKARYNEQYGGWLRSGEYLGAYWEARAKYHIGQRLRPCLGCGAYSMMWSVSGDICDGSGVLPARRGKK